METAGRRSALMNLLRETGRVEVADAARRFDAAEMTIRRDLDALVTQGLARRIRGGAVSLLFNTEEPPYAARTLSATIEKQRIGRATADLIADGESVVLDSGTTTLEVANFLTSRRVMVMPLSLRGAWRLASGEDVRLVMPGGQVRPGELSIVGPLATASLASLRFDTAVLSCCGLAGGQVTAHDLGDAEVKRAMRASATRTILVADSSKLARAAMAVVCPTSQVDVLVTDGRLPTELVTTLGHQGVEVVIV